MTRWILWTAALCVSAGCELDNETRSVRGSFDPPEEPAHRVSQDGAMHAAGYETPFLCRDPERAGFGPCPDDLRPLRPNLSCDASGCHGDTTYSPDMVQSDRHLLGSDGPSCWSCHDREWSNERGGQD